MDGTRYQLLPTKLDYYKKGCFRFFFFLILHWVQTDSAELLQHHTLTPGNEFHNLKVENMSKSLICKNLHTFLTLSIWVVPMTCIIMDEHVILMRLLTCLKLNLCVSLLWLRPQILICMLILYGNGLQKSSSRKCYSFLLFNVLPLFYQNNSAPDSQGKDPLYCFLGKAPNPLIRNNR